MEIQMVEVPEWVHRRWHDIIKSAIGVGEWAQNYSRGYIKPEDGDFPTEPPTVMPLFDTSDEDLSWYDWQFKELYAEPRQVGDTGFPGLTTEERAKREPIKGRDYHEYHFGTYCVFRVTNEENRIMCEGYGEEPNCCERVLEDGDHVIIVYML